MSKWAEATTAINGDGTAVHSMHISRDSAYRPFHRNHDRTLMRVSPNCNEVSWGHSGSFKVASLF